MLHAFEMGAEGVFIAGCGEQCARENTAEWVHQRVEKVKKTLREVGLEPERIQAFTLKNTHADIDQQMEKFSEKTGNLYLASIIMQEVKK